MKRVRKAVGTTLLVLVVSGMAAGTALAQEGDDEGAGVEGRGDPEATEVLRANLIDRQGTADRADDVPLVGVELAIATVDGEPVGVAISDEEGQVEFGLPGPGSYTVTMDVDTLPDDVGLAEGAETLAVVLAPGETRILIFEIGVRDRVTQSRWDRLPTLIFQGIQFGLVIGICAVGLSLIFGTTGLVNFAHGEMVTWGAIVAWFLNVDAGMHLIPATLLAIVVGGITGALLDRILWRPLRHRGMSLVAMMIVSIGLSLMVRNFFQLIFGETTSPYRQYVVQSGVDIGPIRVAPKDLWSIAVSLTVLVLVAVFLRYTRLGKATRAVSDNPNLAASSGINVDRVVSSVWFLGGGLAALGGVIFAVGERVQFDMGFKLLLLMFAGITLGGLGSAYGALLGSLIIGIFVQTSTLIIPTELKNAGALAVLILVLLVRPQGLLGQAERVG